MTQNTTPQLPINREKLRVLTADERKAVNGAGSSAFCIAGGKKKTLAGDNHAC